ncbi:hypothetical protein Hypma_004596 [Hypsizygus marmoreus]|uniref:BTB domain-containing protein n=1 Tax=Hypsizygus marmoreus TaxID=39966 RepID=A0A369JXS6_HYPMA|nr:hypothetical protein Hypma_004596 [Hypsizygus marmoreus]
MSSGISIQVPEAEIPMFAEERQTPVFAPSSWPKPPPARYSSLFSSEDGDVTFRSSDRILFNIHRKNLETNTAGFPPGEFSTKDEIVDLTEDSTTLELLFQFVYPKRHPDLDSIPFIHLARVAEAAEKYEVFPAVNICKIRMRGVLPRHPLEIACYADRHGYRDIIKEVEQPLLDIPLEETVEGLTPSMVVGFVQFYQSWNTTILNAVKSACTDAYQSSSGTSLRGRCGRCNADTDAVLGRMIRALGEKRSRKHVESWLQVDHGACAHVMNVRESLTKELDGLVGLDHRLYGVPTIKKERKKAKVPSPY